MMGGRASARERGLKRQGWPFELAHAHLGPPSSIRLQALLSAGANRGATDNSGENALHDLVRCFESDKEAQFLEAARALLRGGVSAMAPSHEGTTPLVSSPAAALEGTMPAAELQRAGSFLSGDVCKLLWSGPGAKAAPAELLAALGATKAAGQLSAAWHGGARELYPLLLPLVQALAASKGYYKLEQVLRAAGGGGPTPSPSPGLREYRFGDATLSAADAPAALCGAAGMGDVSVVRLMVAAGVPVDISADEGITPL